MDTKPHSTLLQELTRHCGGQATTRPQVEPMIVEFGTATIASGMTIVLSTDTLPMAYLPLWLEGGPDHPRRDLWATSLRVGAYDMLLTPARLSTLIGPSPAALAHLAREMSVTLGLTPDAALADLRSRYGPLQLSMPSTPFAYPGMGVRLALNNRRGRRAPAVTLRLTLHVLAMTP